METESTVLMRLSEMDRLLAETDDPLKLKKGSDIIEAIRKLAQRSHLSLEIVNQAFYERVRWDRKRGQWIQKNIPKHNESSAVTRLDDINTSKNESSYCQRLLLITNERVLHLIGLCNSKEKEVGKAALLRCKEDGSENYKPPDLPPGIFEVIYADPGWQYNNFNVENAAQALYTTWPVEEICDKWEDPINKVSNNQSVLFLWATNPMLQEAFQVMSVWGFKYKTNMVWVKDQARGKAWWARSQHELLLIGVRSKTAKPVWVPPSALLADRREHSQKPDEFRTVIEKMFPLGSWLEVNAREQHDGWISYGDEL